MKMIQVCALAVLGSAIAGANAGLRAGSHSGAAPLATDTSNTLIADAATRKETDKLLHLLVEDEEKTEKKRKEKKEKQAKTEEKKTKKAEEEEATIVNEDAEEFMSACLVHTAAMVQRIDRSYTDVQLRTVLRNECLLSKEFPKTYKSGFDSHKACMEFSDTLADARNNELAGGSTKGYKTFCQNFYAHKGGLPVGLKDDAVTAEKSGRGAFNWVWRVWVLVIAIALFLGGILACVCLRKRQVRN